MDHKVVGGYNKQNFFQIEGPGIGTRGNYSGNACPTNTELYPNRPIFISRKTSNDLGLAIQQATYPQTADGERLMCLHPQRHSNLKLRDKH